MSVLEAWLSKVSEFFPHTSNPHINQSNIPKGRGLSEKYGNGGFVPVGATTV